MKKILVLGLLFTMFSAVAFSQQTQRTNQQVPNTVQQKRVKTNKIVLPAERKRLQQRRIDKKKEVLRAPYNRQRPVPQG